MSGRGRYWHTPMITQGLKEKGPGSFDSADFAQDDTKQREIEYAFEVGVAIADE